MPMAENLGVRISLVIVTYNRAEELLRLLGSLEEMLARTDVEVVLVDDGSTDGTIERVSPVLAPLGDRLQIIRQANSGPGVGRNRGILCARGEIVGFIDTDCVVHPGWLDALVAPFADAHVGAVGGPDRSQPDDPLLMCLIDYLMTAFLTTGGVRGAKKARGGSYHPRSFNMAVRREAAVAAEGFPTIWYGEDILFSWRVAQVGWKLEFAPDAWVYHRRRTTLRGWARQLYRMGRARWWMGRYDRRLLDPIYVLPLAEWIVGLAALVGIASGGFWRTAGCAVVAAAAFYACAIGLDGWRRVGHTAALVGVPAMFFLREAAYALGSLAGIFSGVPDLRGALSRNEELSKGGAS